MATLQTPQLPPETLQLDRLGRELKCPICLSLFKQAASLSCNHSFCTSCILQSMKRTPSCPICKVPTTRREVRAAPHMDSLVAIYVSMESAAGVNLLSSQATAANVPGDLGHVPPKQKQRGKNRKALSNITDNVREAQNKKKRVLYSPVSPEQLLKGFIPAKKRVQVPRFPSLSGELGFYEDDAQPAVKSQTTERTSSSGLKRTCAKVDMKSANKKRGREYEKEALNAIPVSASPQVVQFPENKRLSQRKNKDFELVTELSNTQVGRHTNAQSEIEKEKDEIDALAIDDIGRPKLDPFFWLREDSSQDVDGTETQVQVTQLTQTQPSLRPNFSDLKDNDDQCVEEHEEEVTKGGSAEADGYDSDAFEWTQRSCSPELMCSPSKEQVTEKLLVIDLPMESAKAANENMAMPIVKCCNKKLLLEESSMASPSKVPLLESTVAVASTNSKKVVKRVSEGESFDHESQVRRSSGRLETLSKSCKASKLAVAEGSSKDSMPQKDDFGCSIRVRQQSKQSKLGQKDSNGGDRQLSETLANDATDSVDKKSRLLEKRRVAASTFCEKPYKGKAHDFQRQPKKTQFSGKKSRDESEIDVGKVSQISEKDSGDGLESSKIACVFCRTSGDSQVAGPIMHYKDGIPVEDWESTGKLVHVHKLCAEWAPDVYFLEDVAKNLAVEVARGQKIKCSSCGMKGAALGCCLKRCRKSFHYPCARALSCRWDNDNFIILCPEHAAYKFPIEKRKGQAARMTLKPDSKNDAQVAANAHKSSIQLAISAQKVLPKWPSGPASKWVLCGSALDSSEKEQLASFVSLTGATLVKAWDSSVTHVIAGTDEHGAARRTLKFLMAILEGKWILKADWMAACTVAGKPVYEEAFEISVDIHRMADGPKRGRSLAAAKEPKLFGTLDFYFSGDYVASYKAHLQALVVAAGGVVLHRKPVTVDSGGQKRTIVVYSKETPPSEGNGDQAKEVERRHSEAKSLATLVGAHVAPHSWILDSIASCKLQPVD